MKYLILLAALAAPIASASDYHTCNTVAEMTGMRMDAETLEMDEDRISMPTTIRINLTTAAASVTGWDDGDCAAIGMDEGMTVICTGGNQTSIAMEMWRLKNGVASLMKGRHTSGIFGSAHSLFAGEITSCE